MDAARPAIGDAADAMSDDELEQAIAALHARERELLITGDSTAAFGLIGTKFTCWRHSRTAAADQRRTVPRVRKPLSNRDDDTSPE
ncbi:hypothetical protein [Rhodococcus indonesiensis]